MKTILFKSTRYSRLTAPAAIAAAMFLVLFPHPAAAWSGPVHEMIAEESADILPAETRLIVRTNREAYMKGVSDQRELFELVAEDRKEAATPELVIQKGIELFIYHVQRLNFFFDKKSEERAIAYELGRMARVAADLLEPLPPEEDFGTLEIAGHRIFFLDDAEQGIKNFKYVYAAREPIRSFPVRLDKELGISRQKGSIIYKAYREGRPYEEVEDHALVMMNRAINLLADTVYTLQKNRGRQTGSPFDPAEALGLDRWRREPGDESRKVAPPPAPRPPDAPVAPDIPEEEEPDETTYKAKGTGEGESSRESAEEEGWEEKSGESEAEESGGL